MSSGSTSPLSGDGGQRPCRIGDTRTRFIDAQNPGLRIFGRPVACGFDVAVDVARGTVPVRRGGAVATGTSVAAVVVAASEAVVGAAEAAAVTAGAMTAAVVGAAAAAAGEAP